MKKRTIRKPLRIWIPPAYFEKPLLIVNEVLITPRAAAGRAGYVEFVEVMKPKKRRTQRK